MEDNIKDGVEAVDVSNDGENRKNTTYPIRNLNGVIEFVGSVYKKYGANDYHTPEIIADANGLAVNSIKQLLSTAQQYGLLKKSHGVGYKITSLFTTIFHPVDENEKNKAILDSLKHVQFYSQLFANYEGQMIPSITGLVNTFVRNYKMKNNVAQKAADVFIQNLKEHHLINDRNILIHKYKTNNTNTINPHPIDKEVLSPIEDVKTQATKEASGGKLKDEDESMIKIPIRLKDKRMAYLSFPVEYDEQDLKRILKVVTAYAEIYGDDDIEK